jgi:Mor family transcriptional regulator
VSRTRSPVIAKRNDEIFAQWQRGKTLTALGEQYGISRQVVGRIVAERHPEEDEDLDRSVYRGYLWRLFDEVKDLFDAPGYKMSPTGRPAEDPNGDPAEDTNVKLQAAELELKVLESLRKLDARDRPQKSHVTVDVAQQQANVFLAEVREKIAADQREKEALRRAAVIPGEVVRELPAS